MAAALVIAMERDPRLGNVVDVDVGADVGEDVDVVVVVVAVMVLPCVGSKQECVHSIYRTDIWT